MKTEGLTINGVSVGAGAEGFEEAPDRTIDLPSGARAVIRAGRGRDLMRAQSVAAGKGGAAVAFALIAELARIDNQRIVYEDVLDMELADVMALQREVLGGNFSLPPQRISPDSSDSDSQPEN